MLNLLCTLSLLGAVGCALPMYAQGAPTGLGLGAADRVLLADQSNLNTAPADFSFILPGEPPLVVLAGPRDLWSGALLANREEEDAWSRGESEWIGNPWRSRELAVSRAVDMERLPTRISLRAGEPFVTEDGVHGQCLGHLGHALLLVRIVNRSNLIELLENTNNQAASGEEQAFLDGDGEQPPTERLSDPEFIWNVARRTYVVAAWEPDSDCRAGSWGHLPDHMAIEFSEIPAEPWVASAHALFEATPEYAANQARYDHMLPDLDPADGWAPGPWDRRLFSVSVFQARDGRRLLIASAGHDECDALDLQPVHRLYEVTVDDALRFRRTLTQLPPHFFRSLLERDGELEFLGNDTLWGLDRRPVQSIAPLDFSCGC